MVTRQSGAGLETPDTLYWDGQVVHESYNTDNGGRVFRGVHEIVARDRTLTPVEGEAPVTIRIDRVDLLHLIEVSPTLHSRQLPRTTKEEP